MLVRTHGHRPLLLRRRVFACRHHLTRQKFAAETPHRPSFYFFDNSSAEKLICKLFDLAVPRHGTIAAPTAICTTARVPHFSRSEKWGFLTLPSYGDEPFRFVASKDIRRRTSTPGSWCLTLALLSANPLYSTTVSKM